MTIGWSLSTLYKTDMSAIFRKATTTILQPGHGSTEQIHWLDPVNQYIKSFEITYRVYTQAYISNRSAYPFVKQIWQYESYYTLSTDMD